MKTLVVLPTYNEKENVSVMVKEIFSKLSEVDILVVDDNSPDGTAEVVKKMQSEIKNLFLIVRKNKEGLGRAYLESFRWALENKYEVIAQMDCDFSHRPEDLVKLLVAIKAPSVDFVIGSRYVSGGSIPEWEMWRRGISRMGSLYAKSILGYPIRDWTGGFNVWKSHVLRKLDLKEVSSNGYSFQIEMKYRASRLGFKGVEVPIVFDKRQKGQSKMSWKIVFEALFKVWVIRFA